MRKRTQLVGFEYGHWKNVQYINELLDNALDAIESFQWGELSKEDSKILFSLDQDLFLGSLTIVKSERKRVKSEPLPLEVKQTLMKEFGFAPPESDEEKFKESNKTTNKKVQDERGASKKGKIEIEEEVKNILDDMNELIIPVEYIVDLEPIVIIRLKEQEAPSFLTTEIAQKNVKSYTIEIFDNGTGMSKNDMRKFGRYLASSKSMQLKQTRGSQGFGAPSAFSDAQNTTGKPIVVISSTADNIFAIVSEFFTTSKNEKKYIVRPTEVDSPFLHGTYVKLHYLNVKYIRGYVDKFVEETAYMNPHITIIFIDPNGEENIYQRLVSSFPKEPKYALPHPSSINIGDFQDLTTKSENNTVSPFLQENFVRITPRISKQILDLASNDLQDKLNLLIIKDSFLTKVQNKTDVINLFRFEKRIFGKSQKPRDKLIVYRVASEELKEKYWDLMSKYDEFSKKHEKINKDIKKKNVLIDKSETQKEIKSIEKEIKVLLNEIASIRKEKDELKLVLEKLFKTYKNGLNEVKKLQNRTEFEDLINEVQITKAKPYNLSTDQFNSFFLAFKSIKYQAPPTDTAIPVGDTVLENTLIKEIGLKISGNIDDFALPEENIIHIMETLRNEKKKMIIEDNTAIEVDSINDIKVDLEEINDLNLKILGRFDASEIKLEGSQFKQAIEDILTYSDDKTPKSYEDVFEYFLVNYTKDDDFVAAETRPPTSGKGLAYVVEAVMAHSKNLNVPKRSRDVLSRFVNRTPKLRDSADCAITKAVQSVNWKNYKLDTYDNNLPKGPIKLLVNISGPYVHLMFKSQSKNALADDESLIKEIKYCLEAIGRRMRIYINRKQALQKNEKRASLIEKHIPKFVDSIFSITQRNSNSIYKDKISKTELQNLMKNAIGKKTAPVISQPIPEVEAIPKAPQEDLMKKIEVETKDIVKKEPEIKEQKKEKPFIKEPIVEQLPVQKEKIDIETLNNWTVKKLRTFCSKKGIEIPSKIRKTDIIQKIEENLKIKKKVVQKSIIEKKPEIEKKPVAIRPLVPGTIKQAKSRLQTARGETSTKKVAIKTPSKSVHRAPPPKPKKQAQLPIITTERIIGALSDEWQTIKHLIFKLKIKDMLDARFLQIKLKELERKTQVSVYIKKGKKHFRLK